MHLLNVILSIVIYSTACLAIGFKARIENIPKQIIEPYHSNNKIVVNGYNYPARIKVDLYNLDKDSNDFTSLPALVDEHYSFKYDGLSDGEYELVVNSYDFALYNNRYRIIVENEKILAYEDYLHSNSYNVSSKVDVSQTPLVLKYRETKQFYEKAGGSIFDIVLNSPLGFIFKNRTYTIIFTVMVAVSVAPYILQVVNPDFADQLKEMQAEVANERVVKSSSLSPTPPLAQPPASRGATASGSRGKEGSARKRR
ncbi:uncharacterized protein J8A68_000363 [[Candida] subhashii]|uniref:ER membrane protein complex subunit 7 beta-sandwich domain-containing protein n=1 Tax=[Candida] subhashii TaxID=561895 RepID=A0A8J5UUW0_9ASCO|nr:uncharacterized protein J8A68_000363 [[Candida] subhashii]KAG7666107.1 hypothetical protein J8A68_000363 [[Candida] subhashii]